jgi:hypothetical protein
LLRISRALALTSHTYTTDASEAAQSVLQRDEFEQLVGRLLDHDAGREGGCMLVDHLKFEQLGDVALAVGLCGMVGYRIDARRWERLLNRLLSAARLAGGPSTKQQPRSSSGQAGHAEEDERRGELGREENGGGRRGGGGAVGDGSVEGSGGAAGGGWVAVVDPQPLIAVVWAASVLDLPCPPVLSSWADSLPFRLIPGGLAGVAGGEGGEGHRGESSGGRGAAIGDAAVSAAAGGQVVGVVEGEGAEGNGGNEEQREQLRVGEDELFAAVVQEVPFEQDEIVTATGMRVVEQRGTAWLADDAALVFPYRCPAPHALHPIPYILHPTPYTLHPTPYTLHPTPCTLHPAPCTLHPAPCTLHPAPCTLPCTPNPNRDSPTAS